MSSPGLKAGPRRRAGRPRSEGGPDDNQRGRRRVVCAYACRRPWPSWPLLLQGPEIDLATRSSEAWPELDLAGAAPLIRLSAMPNQCLLHLGPACFDPSAPRSLTRSTCARSERRRRRPCPRRVLLQQLLDLRRIDVHAGGLDHALEAQAEVEEAVRVMVAMSPVWSHTRPSAWVCSVAAVSSADPGSRASPPVRGRRARPPRRWQIPPSCRGAPPWPACRGTGCDAARGTAHGMHMMR